MKNTRITRNGIKVTIGTNKDWRKDADDATKNALKSYYEAVTGISIDCENSDIVVCTVQVGGHVIPVLLDIESTANIYTGIRTKNGTTIALGKFDRALSNAHLLSALASELKKDAWSGLANNAKGNRQLSHTVKRYLELTAEQHRYICNKMSENFSSGVLQALHADLDNRTATQASDTSLAA